MYTKVSPWTGHSAAYSIGSPFVNPHLSHSQKGGIQMCLSKLLLLPRVGGEGATPRVWKRTNPTPLTVGRRPPKGGGGGMGNLGGGIGGGVREGRFGGGGAGRVKVKVKVKCLGDLRASAQSIPSALPRPIPCGKRPWNWGFSWTPRGCSWPCQDSPVTPFLCQAGLNKGPLVQASAVSPLSQEPLENPCAEVHSKKCGGAGTRVEQALNMHTTGTPCKLSTGKVHIEAHWALGCEPSPRLAKYSLEALPHRELAVANLNRPS